MYNRMRRGASVVGAAGLIVMAGAVAVPAVAADDEAPVPTEGKAFAEYTQSAVKDTKEAVVGSGVDAEGNVILYVDTEKKNSDEVIEQYTAPENVKDEVVEVPGGADAYADTDVVGGAGYFTSPDVTAGGQGGVCSVGFPGWTKDGEPAFITAGHCTDDGGFGQAAMTVPSNDPAGGGPADGPVQLIRQGTVDFNLGQSQYGGPGNDPGDPDNPSEAYTDIAAYDRANDDLNLLPQVTDWQNTDDLSQSTMTEVKSVGEANVGSEATRSGRTSQPSSGTVAEHGYMLIGDETDARLVGGFRVDGMEAIPGDSGGSIVQGDTAVGVVSGGQSGANPFVWGTDLQKGLAQLDGYTVKLDIDAPELTSPENGGQVPAGGEIKGTGPAGQTLVVTANGNETEVEIDGDGNWSFPAPSDEGTYNFTLKATDGGYNESEEVEASVEVVADLAAPTITAPADGSSHESKVDTISGEGEPGATITLGGDAEGEATVGEDGKWSVGVDLGIGAYTVNAAQEVEGDAAGETSTTFSVTPAAPVIESPKDGVNYEKAPTEASGTGIDGAQIMVYLDDEHIGTTDVADGKWAVPFEELGSGDHKLRVTQTVNGQSSEAGVSFSVIDAAGGPPPDDGDLPGTGAGAMLPLILGGIALAAGGLTLALRRRGQGEAPIA